MREIKVWPHLTIIAVIIAVAAGVGVGLWMKRNQTASAESVMTAGRIAKVDGDVSVASATTTTGSELQWSQAAANTPFSVGDRIYTNDNAQASLAFSGRNFARLQPNTSLDVLSLDRQRTQLALRDGSAMFDVGYLEPGQVFEVATPYGAVDFNQPGLYDVGIGDNGNVLVSVLSGLAQVVGLGGTGQISKGEMLTLLGQTAAEIALSRINGNDAGYLVDDYYQYQYPQYYDGRYSDYNTYLNDPNYFDPYRRNVSYQYASPYIPGLGDLDYYGNWQNVNGYGYAWTPRVSNGWSPYQQGHWVNDYPYGPTWMSSEPWGYAPYHYGRWAFVGDRWYWVPDGVNTTPMYSPALVGFIPSQNEIGWVPLAPGDPYAYRYYDQDWNPYYLSRQDMVQRHLVNLGVPGAVAMLPIDSFVNGFEDGRIRRWDGRRDGTSAYLDPLLLTPLRNAVVHSAWGYRGKKDLPPGISKKLMATQVIVGSDPVVLPPFKRDSDRRFGVSTVPDNVKQKHFKVKDERADKQSEVVPSDVRDNRGNRGDSSSDPMRKELKRAEQSSIERGNRGQGQNAEGARVANPAAEQKQKPAAERKEVRKAQPEMRRTQPAPGKPEKPKGKPGLSAQSMRQSAPSIQRHGPPARVQQQQQLRVDKGGGQPARVQHQQQTRANQGGGQPARVQHQQQTRANQGGGAPARAEQKQQGGGRAKQSASTATAASQGGGGGKGKGKGKG